MNTHHAANEDGPIQASEPRSMSAQSLVDAYVADAPDSNHTDVDPARLRRAVDAAHELERRGYVERSGTWFHASNDPVRPTHTATAPGNPIPEPSERSRDKGRRPLPFQP